MYVATGESPRLISCQEGNLGHFVPPQAGLLLTLLALDHAFFVHTLFLVPALVFGNHLLSGLMPQMMNWRQRWSAWPGEQCSSPHTPQSQLFPAIQFLSPTAESTLNIIRKAQV